MSLGVPGLTQKTDDNPFNYTDDQRDERRMALKAMKELYPQVSNVHAEWVYDLCRNTPDDELRAIMKKVDETPSRFVTCNDPRSPLYR